MSEALSGGGEQLSGLGALCAALPEAQLVDVLRVLPEALTVVDSDGRFVFVNDLAARVLGFGSAVELASHASHEIAARFETFSEEGKPMSLAELPTRRVFREKRRCEQVLRFRPRPAGEDRLALLVCEPIFDAQGNVTRAVNVFRDVSESRRSERALRFLAEASATLGESLDYERTLQAVASAAVPTIADWCAVELVEEGSVSRQVAVAHQDPAKVKLAWDLREKYPPPQDDPNGLPEVIRTGKPQIMGEIPHELLVLGAKDAEHLRLIESLQLRGYMIVPLKARGKIIGGLTLVSAESGRRLGPTELAMAETLASRAAQAVDNARLYRETERARDRLGFALEAGRLGSWEWNVQTGRVFWSPRLEQIHGIPVGSFAGTFEAYQSDMHPDDKPRVLAQVQAALTGSETDYEIRYRIQRPDGQVRWLEARGLFERDAAGKALRLAGVCTDVTGKLAAEELSRKLAIEQVERRNAEAAGAHAALQLALGEDVGRALADKEIALEEMLRRCAEACAQRLGAELSLLFTAETPGGPLSLTARAGADAGQASARIDVVRFSRETAASAGPIDDRIDAEWARERALSSFAAAPLRIGERLVGVLLLLARAPLHERSPALLASVSDAIAQGLERRRAELSLERHAGELLRSNAELQQFAYVASHDLQEPLRMVASYTQLLARRYKGKLDADADDFIRFAVEGVGRMQALINDLLLYSRVGTKGKTLERIDAQAALEEAAANLSVMIEETGARIGHARLPGVRADKGQLVQLFQNLLGNALKFRGKEAPRVEVSAQPAGQGMVELRVSDNGIGIPEEYRERVFVIFQRLHTRAEFPGNGIGLSIVKKIVERHGGRIAIESSPLGGATFKFTLPAA